MENDKGIRVEGFSCIYSLHGNEAPIKCKNVLVKIS